MDKQQPMVGEVRVVQTESFEERMMKVDPRAGAKKFTVWQLDPRHKRFNAHGCL